MVALDEELFIGIEQMGFAAMQDSIDRLFECALIIWHVDFTLFITIVIVGSERSLFDGKDSRLLPTQGSGILCFFIG